MKRILLIPSSDYLGHPFPQRHNQIFERLNDGNEFEVHVLRFNIFGKSKLKTNCIIHELPIEFKLRRAPLYYLANAPIYVREIMKIIRQESIDVVVAGNLLPLLLFEMVRELSGYKIPIVFDLQDYYPTSAAGYVCDVNGFLGRTLKGFFETMVRLIIRMSDIVTVPGIALYEYVKKTNPSKNVVIVPNGISEHFLKQYDGTRIREKLSYSQEDIVVGYVGSIEFWLDLKPLFSAISKMLMRGMAVKLLLIGKNLQTNYSEKVMEWIKEYNLCEITTWLDFIPYEMVPEYMAAMDIGTIPFNVRDPTAYYAAPNKLWEYMSQARRVTATPIPEALQYQNLIEVVGDEEDYLRAIAKIDHQCTYLRKQTSVETILKERMWCNSANKMKEIIDTVVGKRRKMA